MCPKNPNLIPCAECTKPKDPSRFRVISKTERSKICWPCEERLARHIPEKFVLGDVSNVPWTGNAVEEILKRKAAA
jgi:hypothetical protein